MSLKMDRADQLYLEDFGYEQAGVNEVLQQWEMCCWEIGYRCLQRLEMSLSNIHRVGVCRSRSTCSSTQLLLNSVRNQINKDLNTCKGETRRKQSVLLG